MKKLILFIVLITSITLLILTFSSKEFFLSNKDLDAISTIVLPDIYDNGHGWTCTGLAYDKTTNTFLIGDIGKELPSSEGFASQIVRVSSDFSIVIEKIPLYISFPNMKDVQGIAIDTSDATLWVCSPAENLIRHIDKNGESIGSFSVKKPTGISYSPIDDSIWVLTYENKNNIKRMSKNGLTYEQHTFKYGDTLDQCFLDYERGYLFITAGANYSDRNNVYLFNTKTHTQSVAYTVDSYSVEGIYVNVEQMIIVNDGYYHNAEVAINQANIYSLSNE